MNSNNTKRKVIHRLYCIINRHTDGLAKITRSDLRFHYDVNKWEVVMDFPQLRSEKYFINELSQRLNCNVSTGHFGTVLVNDNEGFRVSVNKNYSVHKKDPVYSLYVS